ncbi:MAG: metallophosphoesterase [Patescibacteria group bacterium]
MRTVFLSDTHLSAVVEPARLRYLASLTSRADKLFILGDLWDKDLCTFDEFINSNWQVLFPIWLDREAEYLYGNHDPRNSCDERVAYFSTKQYESLDGEVDGLKLHLEHGHRIVRTHNPLLDWIARFRLGTEPVGYHFLRWVAPRALKTLGEWAVKFRDGGGTQKLTSQASQYGDRISICGHTHAAVMDLKNRYANCGFIDFGWGQYILIENGEIKLIKERY